MNARDGIAARTPRGPVLLRLRAALRSASLGRAWRGLAVALALLVGSPFACAESDAMVAEYRIKAAFLFKFLAFVEWPPAAFERPDTPLVIGVVDAGTLAGELEQITSGRNVNGHPVRVRVLARGDSVAGLQVLFIGRANAPRLGIIAAAADSAPMLLVSESDTALAQGSAINFVVVDDKVRFDVALHPLNKAGLKLSARLLAVARTVQADPS